LRATIESSKAGWKVHADLHGSSPLPRYPLGGNTGDLKPAQDATPVDWSSVAAQLPANAGVAARRLALDMVPKDLVTTAKAMIPARPSKQLTGTKVTTTKVAKVTKVTTTKAVKKKAKSDKKTTGRKS
jgi:hypothetical protein